MANEIKTFYSDSAKTNAIYPRTKQNAITNADGDTMGDVGFLSSTTKVSGVSSPLIYAQPFGIDTDRLITSGATTGASTVTYTATEDCYVVATGGGSSSFIGASINSVLITRCCSASASNVACICVLLKSGQTISLQNSANTAGTYSVYGLKY